MDALIFCPRCQWQLRLPGACIGQTVCCPACAGVFEASTGAIAVSRPGPAATAGPRDTISTRPLPEPDRGQVAMGGPTWFGRACPRRCGGLLWVVAGQVLDLVVLGLNLTLLCMGILEPDPDAQIYLWDDWGWPITCLMVPVLLTAGCCMFVGFARWQGYPDESGAGCLSAAFIFLVYLLRLVSVTASVAGGGQLGALRDVSGWYFWEEWFFWAGLLPRWALEAMLLFVLSHLGWSWQSGSTLPGLRWALVWLVAEALLQLAVIAGLLERWQTRLATHLCLDKVWVGALLTAPMLLARLGVISQVFRALHAARCALAENGTGGDPDEEILRG